jgi:hypothetical protein
MTSEQLFTQLANDPALPLPIIMLASWQVRLGSGSCGVIDLSQHGFCQIGKRQQKKPSISIKKG